MAERRRAKQSCGCGCGCRPTARRQQAGVDSAGTGLRAQRHCSNFYGHLDSFCAARSDAFRFDHKTRKKK
jgi:hypothetical protein